MNKVYYSQIDNRWATHPYPSPALPYATIGSGGCGAASAAMIVSMLKEIITPDKMGDIFVRDGIRVNGGTSNRAFDSYLTDKYGLKVQRNWKIAEAKECLEKGGLVVARCLGSKGKLFTTGGHFVVFVGFKNNEFEVFDPYLYSTKFDVSYRKGKARMVGTSVFVTYENMQEYGGYNELWCYEGTGVDTNNDTDIPETKPAPANTKGQTRKFARDTYMYANSDLSGTRYSYLKNTTVKIIDNISSTVDYVYVPATGRYAYVEISAYYPVETSTNSTVGQTRKFAHNTYMYSNPDLTGTYYSYLKNTTVKILENTSARVDKVNVPATGRTAYVDNSVYYPVEGSNTPAPQPVSYRYMTVTARSGLNCREKPSTSAKIVTGYAYKTKVKVYSIENGWAKGDKGYMYAQYLK